MAALDVLATTDKRKWDGDFLRRLIARWRERSSMNDEAIRDWLWRQVTPERSIEQLSYSHYVLEVLPGGVDRKSFFERCGRWPAPELPRLVPIPAGEFLMGSPENEPVRGDDETQHRVRLSVFSLSATVVTNAEYQRFDPHRKPKVANHPVVNVSWWEARLYCLWLGGRLPTEAEWEYSCRGGTETPFSYGENITPELVNYNGNYPYAGGAKGKYREKTVPVGSLPANPWGIHEMHGNVDEWCSDWYAPYDAEVRKDPKGPDNGESRVLRGGSWYRYAWRSRSALRIRLGPGYRNDYFGFRLARDH